jgi:hypothetical protein
MAKFGIGGLNPTLPTFISMGARPLWSGQIADMFTRLQPYPTFPLYHLLQIGQQLTHIENALLTQSLKRCQFRQFGISKHPGAGVKRFAFGAFQ